MVLKRVIRYTMQKSGHMVLKGVSRVHNDEIRSNGLERSNLSTQYKNQVKWSWKESVNWVHNETLKDCTQNNSCLRCCYFHKQGTISKLRISSFQSYKSWWYMNHVNCCKSCEFIHSCKEEILSFKMTSCLWKLVKNWGHRSNLKIK